MSEGDFDSVMNIIKVWGPSIPEEKLLPYHDYLIDKVYSVNDKKNLNVIASLINVVIPNEKLAHKIFDAIKDDIYLCAIVGKHFSYASMNDKSQSMMQVMTLLSAQILSSQFPGIENYLLPIEQSNKRIFNSFFSYAVPDTNAIEKILEFAENDQILEIGSGLGLWSGLLRKKGITIWATDIGDEGEYYNQGTLLNKERLWTEIEIMDHKQAIRNYGDLSNVLFLCWPTPNNSSPVESVELFKGEKLIYVGECPGGSTANENFFRNLYKNFSLKEVIEIPQWRGVFDKMYFFVRKK